MESEITATITGFGGDTEYCILINDGTGDVWYSIRSGLLSLVKRSLPVGTVVTITLEDGVLVDVKEVV